MPKPARRGRKIAPTQRKPKSERRGARRAEPHGIQLRRAAFHSLICKLIATEGPLTRNDVLAETAFELNVSIETARRYLDKHTARREHFSFTEGGKVTCPHALSTRQVQDSRRQRRSRLSANVCSTSYRRKTSAPTEARNGRHETTRMMKKKPTVSTSEVANRLAVTKPPKTGRPRRDVGEKTQPAERLKKKSRVQPSGAKKAKPKPKKETKRNKRGERSPGETQKEGAKATASASPEDRESAKNARMADQLRCVASAPGGFDFMAFAQAVFAGRIQQQDADRAGDLIVGLLSISYRASVNNDSFALKQLEALDRLVYPADYGFSLVKIEKIAKTPISDSLLRAWDLLEIMRRLSFVLETGASGLVKMKRDPDTFDQRLCGKTLFDLVSSPDFWTPTSRHRLKSAAIEIYQKSVSCESDTLYRDLEKAKKWQARNPTGFMKPVTLDPADVDFIPLARTRMHDDGFQLLSLFRMQAIAGSPQNPKKPKPSR